MKHAGTEAQREAARLYAESLRDIVEPMWRTGATTREIAFDLNREGFRTPRGSPWTSMTVCRILWRLKLAKPAETDA